MWPGEQSPGGGQDPRQPPVGHQPNPYQQPGYHQPNPYQQPQPWAAPTQRTGAPVPPPAGGPNRTKLVAVIAAAAVVLAAVVTGVVMLGDNRHDGPGPKPTGTASPSPSSADSRGSGTETATIKGWKVVANPGEGIEFDVPPGWEIQSSNWVTWVSKNGDPDDKPLIAMRAPAFLKKTWCASDDDKDGTPEYSPLAAVGSRGNESGLSTREVAGADPKTWVYGQYTQPDKAKVRTGPVESFTSASGLEGSLGSAWSVGVRKSAKCASDGKAWTFAFEGTDGKVASWSFFGAKNVAGEVPDATIRKIAGTVRKYKVPSDS
ncbi:hypothetical protein AB0N17_26880 [Streptomyces sp. NPDC051133]|uniref:hypothetical protein n=1 Tax=Streptomyces sp. NPDC051133 TaxID=3155521 RepID=UPI0034191C58